MNDRITDAMLNQIRYRLIAGLNDDGLRAWYPADVSHLLHEVLAQRQIIAALEARLAEAPPVVTRPRGRPRKTLLV